MKDFRYRNILKLSTLQFDGHVHDYFVATAKKFVAFYLLPRAGGVKNFIEVYERGKLVQKKNLYSPKHIAFAYIMYYLQYLAILFTYFKRNEKIYFINTLPVFFFFNSLIRRLRNIEIVYWVQDFWPMRGLPIRIFRWFMYFYHKRTRHTIYVSDRINRAMTKGRLDNTSRRKTVMLGIEPQRAVYKRDPSATITLCFVGVIVETQGVDLLLASVAKNGHCKLKLIGTGESRLVRQYRRLITKYKIEDRVFFPNTFYYGGKLRSIVSDCHVGVALYTIDSNTVTYYADPAKIKQYAEFGLPIIMTNAAEVATYIKRFHAGIIVERNVESVSQAIKKLKKDYAQYLAGLQKLNEYFNYKRYYRKAFKFLEA